MRALTSEEEDFMGSFFSKDFENISAEELRRYFELSKVFIAYISFEMEEIKKMLGVLNE